MSYDIIIPSDYMIARMANEGMLKKSIIPSRFLIINTSTINTRTCTLIKTMSIPFRIRLVWSALYMIKTVVSEQDAKSWNVMWNEKYKKRRHT